ncbi:adenylate cyclase [Cichlidogyrus casuarinus]|uniref:Adenylate cyclase n=1 Tax=Cichlidogyrus casuarinus TaxID=1844966 RepID=A0ABD2Q096_9PLAT
MPLSECECDKLAVNNFREYLRFATVHPDPDYSAAVVWLKKQAKELDLKIYSKEIVQGHPILLLEWTGKDATMPAIMCNSHMDVVPVYSEKWTYPPFEAQVHNNKIYARGAQDMKCVGIQQLESIRRLKARGIDRLLRTVYVIFTPDEEVGAGKGWDLLIEDKSPESHDLVNDFSFHDLNIALYLDEGLAHPTDQYVAFFNERVTLELTITCFGNTGHGSSFLPNTAIEKAQKIIGR